MFVPTLQCSTHCTLQESSHICHTVMQHREVSKQGDRDEVQFRTGGEAGGAPRRSILLCMSLMRRVMALRAPITCKLQPSRLVSHAVRSDGAICKGEPDRCNGYHWHQRPRLGRGRTAMQLSEADALYEHTFKHTDGSKPCLSLDDAFGITVLHLRT